MGRSFHRNAWLLLLLPLILSGCCTYFTIDGATHAYRHDRVVRIEKAVVTQDDKLIALVDGTRAESSKIGRFTITAPLPSEENGSWVTREGMQEGWQMPDDSKSFPVAIGPTVVISPYAGALYYRDKFKPNNGTERILYLVRHSSPDKMTSFFYVREDGHPRQIEIGFDGRDVKTPNRYPLLLFVPLTAAVDVALLPFEIPLLLNLGDGINATAVYTKPTQAVPSSALRSPHDQ